MLFYTPEFLVFSVVLLGLLSVIHRNTPRKVVLTVASYVFYMWWNPAFILLIMFSTTVDFFCGRVIGDTKDPKTKRGVLILSLVLNLGVLAFFKYAGFFEANLLYLSRLLGHPLNWATLHVVLPVGISFYTFKTISYTVDVYRGRLPVCRSPLDYALFLCFFPELVPGPLVRASVFLPQLSKLRRVQCDQVTFFLILKGLVKKLIIADNVAQFADQVFSSPERWPSVVIWFATMCFSVQIYCDFSGYSDMAIGIARIVGLELPQNFDKPYFARNPSDFWKRWHITLSSWLRDYLYIPLGGNRGGEFNTYRNLMLTMLLGGLWHGASWNFVVWGAIHGIIQVIHRLYAGWQKSRNPVYGRTSHWLANLVSVLVMQYCVLVTWLVFRIVDTQKMMTALRAFIIPDGRFALGDIGIGNLAFFSTAAVVLVFWAFHGYAYWRKHDYEELLGRARIPAAAVVCCLAGFALYCLWPAKEAPFIYFQF